MRKGRNEHSKVANKKRNEIHTGRAEQDEKAFR